MDELHIHRLAAREFQRATSWYLTRSTRAAVRFMDAVWTAFSEIVESPLAWPTAEDDRHHFRILRRYPYRIIDRWAPGRVYIVAVAHLKRRPRYWARRK